jgi:amino acid adenylation domain-containing protein/non-ribosomal peptide synthase protein (TIGR01720 family)
LRHNLEGNPTFLELLERVRNLTLDAYANQDVPFEQLVEVLQPERSLSHNPLFQVMFVLQNTPTEKLQLPGLNLSLLEIENVTSKFDLTLSMEETDQGLRGVWEYSSDLFDKPTIARMTEHFQTLLSAILSDPQQHLQSLPLLSPSAQHQLLADWNDTKVDYPHQSIDKLFAAQVEKTPDAVAVVFENQQLNTRANQLAHYLIGFGVKPEMLVGIYMERSIDMVVGILAILKAGGAYVPLEPTYPQERLQYMLSDSQVSVLLTQDKWLAQLPHHDAPVVCIDSDWQQISQSSRVNPVNNVAVENLAYVIYTSGSTGKPKGAMNTHKGVCNRLLWMQDSYKLTTADRVLQKTPFSFDVSVWEFLLPLLTGACLVVAKPGGHQDSAYLVELIIQQKITTVHFVPSMLRVFLEEAGIENCTSLRQVFSSGEALPTEIERRFFNRLGCELHNLYGPTEAAIDVTFWQCQPETKLATVPIGYPISNTQMYILDPLLQPVPIGVKGELYIGGINLARGYFQRPELTAEKFIPNPFSQEPGARLYKTGDLARYRDNGSIEFIGRLDHQVKIRGFRIETGEIEAVLATHPAVRQTKVIVIDQPHKYLAAYIVSHQEQPTTSDLRQFLLKYLPDYMVPSAFVILDTLPLNSNGKLDIKALPAPDNNSTNSENFVSPRTRTEEVLVTIWREILGVEQVGIHDNFFELGGDSILSIQIVTRANQAGLQLTPKHLFQHQTIAELATAAIEAMPVQVQQELSTNPAPLLPIQQWFLEQDQPNPHHFNQSILLEIPANTKPELLQEVVEKLLQHHDALRLRFELVNGDWQQQTTNDLKVPFTTFDFSDIPEEQQQQAIELTATDLQTSLDLFTGRVMQVAMFYLGENKPSRLLFVIHHLVVDGVSWRILLEDFTTAYKQVSCGETIKLTPKTTSFQSWTNRLIEYSESEAITAEINYWLAKERSQMLPLPVDYPGDGEINTVASSAKVSVSLSEEQTRALLQEVQAAYNTQINDVLLTAFVQSLQLWTNSSTVLVDLEGHGREELFADVNLSRTIGWFTTLFPVHLQLEKVNNPGEALKSVKEQLRCLPQRGIGYGILKYMSQNKAIRQQLEAFPQPEIIFNYLGQFDQMLTTSPFLKLAKESKGAEHSPHKKRSHLLEISALIASGQLQVDWTYCQKIHQRSTVEHLARNFIDTLICLITHCTYKDAKGYTPSDFTSARLNQKQLDKFIAKIKQNSSN